ncbi:two-component system sensor histidine kinase NtrB [Natrarchaeobius chitinivorans]|uniref:histidine kinase n=1 Tax=Natrarchaeobius chitinivorans TaxID=1679083 RepID=A0A3N6M3W4_NATCH|nr:PAS domain-containing sensor histidine kinase [Natrarchaeobius chitinivorans]RQG95154.1 PAS domain-containing sensor histidine kinase [Natrarchaeobius chitinivorans]
MDHDELVSTFGQTVGVEKARSLVDDALEDLGIDRAETYSSHEVADICETIRRNTDGYLEIVASEIRVREKAQRRFDALLEEISDPVVTVSFNQSSPVVTAINPAFEETFGYGTEVIGESLPELIVPERARADPIDLWFRSDENGTEIDRLTADGERRTFIFQSVVVSSFDGEIEGYGIYTDITERKRRERTLERQNEQLERFVSVVSHDLRNPLTVAQGNAELAAELSSDPEVGERLEGVIAAQERMGTLIDDLLTLASQGKIVDDPCPVRLEAVVSRSWQYVETSAAELEVDVPDGLRIQADGERLCQLFENLFRNAIEHGRADAPAGEPADVTVRVEWEEGVLFVEDDGPGIPPDKREEVFDHGYTTSAEGTGFGLAIVEAIVDAHGWAIDVDEGRTGGARFAIRGISVGDR